MTKYDPEIYGPQSPEWSTDKDIEDEIKEMVRQVRRHPKSVRILHRKLKESPKYAIKVDRIMQRIYDNPRWLDE